MQDDRILYGIFVTPVGEMLLARSAKGIVFLGFTGDAHHCGDVVSRLHDHCKGVDIVRDDAALEGLKDDVLRAWERESLEGVRLDLRGTDFQQQVWRALLTIPMGRTCSYADIAAKIGKPSASRAVGSAVGANPVSLLVPCHRVLRGDGGVGGYAWGVERKTLILALEDAA